MFNPGDKVRVKEAGLGCGHVNEQQVVTVRYIGEDGRLYFNCADGTPCHEPTSKFELVEPKERKPMAFQVGDRVKIIDVDVDGDENDYYPTGHVGEVTAIGDDCYEVDDGYFYPESSLVKVNGESNMDARTVLKNVNLSADDRLLRQKSLEDTDTGTITSYGKDTLLDRLWAENRKAIAADLRKSLKAEKEAEEAEKTSK